MYNLLTGSLGEGQPTFEVNVSEPVSLDQAEQIVMLLKHSIDEAKAMIKKNPEMQYLADNINPPITVEVLPISNLSNKSK